MTKEEMALVLDAEAEMCVRMAATVLKFDMSDDVWLARAAANRAGAAALRREEWKPIPDVWKGSEWFIGALKNGEVREIRRLPSYHSFAWSDRDNTYYAEDWLIAWREIPAPPEGV